ncbi:unnamed protein product [Vitrella brassicaformis CCMP3155]|uniref:Rhodanese domain-containing protein n=1 Tax=Vitrella brassicaformis (strain CCMP3155) TaxID=1169540 RepID=A0A0G4EW62_VITBC|nr:unnamed protein product [Vitrella brassicaformis CCMP3155]|mmetsp:Transcript_41336/g.103162  ORF Transcript_41336/g.103162 Transcript_41336/m.103162 type:complete len:219 (-) Transcript_41336:200-856(-)|eukprot:CEM03187.1 unnamed protein product [Vitrella brassicaformis CCMP3155]
MWLTRRPARRSQPHLLAIISLWLHLLVMMRRIHSAAAASRLSPSFVASVPAFRRPLSTSSILRATGSDGTQALLSSFLEKGETPLEVSVIEAKRWLESEDPPIVLDIREPFEWQMAKLKLKKRGSSDEDAEGLEAERGSDHDGVHAKENGVYYVPMREVGAWVSELDHPDRPILVLCHHGMRSMMITQALKPLGAKVCNVQGGIDQWSVVVDPDVPRY